jgi:hypothetical protein
MAVLVAVVVINQVIPLEVLVLLVAIMEVMVIQTTQGVVVVVLEQ